MFQCASRAELDDWHRDILTYRGGTLGGGRGSLSGLPSSPTGGEIYEGMYILITIVMNM